MNTDYTNTYNRDVVGETFNQLKNMFNHYINNMSNTINVATKYINSIDKVSSNNKISNRKKHKDVIKCANEYFEFRDNLNNHTGITPFNQYDFLDKELIDTFECGIDDFDDFVENKITKVIRKVKYQPVTFAGIIYRVYNKLSHKYEHLLFIGISKMSTNEHYDKTSDEGLEYAMSYALTSPDAIIKVHKGCSKEVFTGICYSLYDNLNLKYMRT